MPILLGVLVSVAVIFAVFAVTLGRGGSMTQFQPDWPGRPLPQERTVRAADVSEAKFSLAFRGYRMAEVDDALDRLAAEIAERDEAILRLSGRPFESQRTTTDSAPGSCACRRACRGTARRRHCAWRVRADRAGSSRAGTRRHRAVLPAAARTR